MKIQELRIGNLVKCKTSNDSAIYSVIQIDGFGLKVRLSHPRHTEFTPLDRIKPIPLTEEILLKCGFKKIKDYGGGEDFWRGKKINLTLDLELSTSNREYDSQSVDGSQKLKYVHQLQNLYFALTGEELEVKL